MTMMQQAHDAYTNLNSPTKTDRALEYDAFAQVTIDLKRAADNTADFVHFAQAVDRNRSLWSLVAASVSDPKNLFSAELRAQLFYLFEFTTLHSQKALKNEANLDALVEINLSVMRGLKTAAVR